jgi:PAS domain S-box-containing protein
MRPEERSSSLAAEPETADPSGATASVQDPRGGGEVVRRVLRVVLPLAAVLLVALLASPRPELAGLANYLPLHTFLETFSIVVASLVFAVAWIAGRPGPRNLAVLGCAFLGVALIDFAHTISYAGMPDFVTPSGAEKAIAFWLAARYLEAGALLYVALSSWAVAAAPRHRYGLLLAALAYTAAVYWLVLFHQDALPATFIPGEGLTGFKIGAEYLLVFLHLVAAALFIARARTPQPFDVGGLATAALLIALSEVFFTRYGDVTDLYNLLGHVYKVIAYAYIGKAVFVDSVRAPYQRLLHSQRALQEANRLSSALFDQNSIAIHMYDAEGVSVRCNQAFERLWRVPARVLNGRFNLLRDTGLAKVLGVGRLNRLLAGELDQVLVDNAYIDPSDWGYPRGRARWVACALFPIKDTAGRVERVVSMQSDISARRQAQVALSKERDFIATVLETAGALVIVLDRDGRIERLNRAAEQSTGLGFEAVKGTRAWERLTAAGEEDLFADALRRLQTGHHHHRFEHWWVASEGERRLITWSATGLYEDGAHLEHAVCTGIDITTAHRAEQAARLRLRELGRVSRAALVGEMASAMAHELNQPLAAVVNYTQGCVRRLRSGACDAPALQEAMEQAAGQAQRAAEIIRNVRDFLRKGEAQWRRVSVNDLVREVARLAEPLAHQQGVCLRLELTEPMPAVLADPLQIEQVTLNLVRNAFDAMGATPAAARAIVIRTTVPDPATVEVAVLDTGSGLSPEVLERLFVPFFTTRSEGLGLGLPLSQSIIEAHGGRLRAMNNPDGGAVFLFTLPVAPPETPG